MASQDSIDMSASSLPVPAHVPPEFVYDFDMYRDPAYLAEPHDRLMELLRITPGVFYTPRNGGHWAILRHAAAFEAARNTDVFSSNFMPEEKAEMLRQMTPPGTYIPRTSPIAFDPPEHGKQRAPLNGPFSPKAVMALKDAVRALAGELIDKVVANGRCDFIADVAEPLPVTVFLRMMGLPLERQAEFRQLVQDFLALDQTDPIAQFTMTQRINGAMIDTIRAREHDRRDDLISTLWGSRIDGDPVTIGDMQNYCVLLFIAGLDTVINGIGFGVRHLARNPDLQAELRARPKLIPEAAEELLRRYSFAIPPRIVAEDTVLAGAPMAKDERAILFLPAANLDEREFPNPAPFDLKRENKVHIAFNSGPHRCPGSHLARIELQIVYEEVLARLPEFRLDPGAPARFHCGNIIGIDTLPIIWEV